jgi:hypothetical protein
MAVAAAPLLAELTFALAHPVALMLATRAEIVGQVGDLFARALHDRMEMAGDR